jgi:hypothetical protein
VPAEGIITNALEEPGSPLSELSEESVTSPVPGPEEPITSSTADAPEETTTSLITSAPAVSAAATSLNPLAESSVVTHTLPMPSAPVPSNAGAEAVPISTNLTEHPGDRSNEHEGALVLRNQVEPDNEVTVVRGAHNSAMDIDSAQGSDTGVINLPQPTDEDFKLWQGIALQSLDSTESLNSEFNWLEYPQGWTTKRGAPKKEAKERLELFGQRVGLMVNALAAHYEIGQSTAWGYTNILRKEVRNVTDYNLYKSWRAAQIRDENGGKAGKCYNCSVSNCLHVFYSG